MSPQHPARPQADPSRSNIRQFPATEPVNPFDLVNKFDLAQWNQIMEDISKPELAKAIVLVMDQRDSLKAMFPSVYVRAHQTCIALEQKAKARQERIAMAKAIMVDAIMMSRAAVVAIRVAIARMTSPKQQSLF